MYKRRLILSLCIILFSLSLFASGRKEDNVFPNHSITIIVPYAKGGGTDVIARAIGISMGKILNQPFIIENKIGGSGAVGMISGAASVPDGYTLTMVTRELVSLPAMGLAEISKDDFQLLALINKDPAVLVVSENSHFFSLDQIVSEAKNTPGKIRFASPAKPHFYIMEFENNQHIIFNKIPYNGAAMAIPAVVNGQADFTLVNPGELSKEIQKGGIRALAIMSNQRSYFMPDIPTFKELGYDITSFTWRGLVVPTGTPKETVLILEKAVKQASNTSEFIREMADAKYSLYYMGSNDFSDFIDQDTKEITSILEKLDDYLFYGND